MHTLGFSFRPWKGDRPIAEGPAILAYLKETARAYGIDQAIRYRHRVERARWSSRDGRWTVDVRVGDGDGETARFTAKFVLVCAGYYDYEAGYTPELQGRERFRGQIVHPQRWPEGLAYEGKRVVVIGSGATAVTVVPAMAKTAGHVTMLQRSPSYVVAVPEKDPIANFLKRYLPPRQAYALTRRKNIWMQKTIFQLSKRRPELVRRMLRAGVKRRLPEGYPVDVHFKPRYNPWDQRLCAVPDGDLFEAISSGSASVVTDTIKTFTEHGIELESGTELQADVIVTATGLNLLAIGGIQLSVDGADVKLPDTMVYKGMMLSDVPNFAFAVGYTNSSWTLKVDLVCEHFTRLLAYMTARGYDTCVAHNDDPTITPLPLLDLGSGYVQRAMHEFPRQGSRAPWAVAMSYAADVAQLRNSPVTDPALKFSHGAHVSDATASPALAA